MLALAAAGEPEGSWLRAEEQTGGRGRMGRVWQSPPGNLYASTLVRLGPSDPAAATLAFVAAVALEAAVANHAAGAQLKWPNDLLLGGAKLAGILLERTGDAVVIGVGVNLAHYPEGVFRPATSLAASRGTAPDPARFLDDLAAAFASWLARWRTEGFAPIRERWLARAHAKGTPLVAILPNDEPIKGSFGGLDADGALILDLAEGGSRAIHAADVFLV